MDYQLVDSGNGQKLERFGSILLARPCAQALWSPSFSSEKWYEADAYFEREDGNKWIEKTKLPSEWIVTIEGVRLKLKKTDFGHLGVFPEHASQWRWIQSLLKKREKPKVLNLFAYSGGASLAAVQAGGHVCHVDSAKGMVDWARENATLNGLNQAPIRWIIDDARKFLTREVRRGETYDAIILDPPSFGRGKSGEVFKIDADIKGLLMNCQKALSKNPLFILFSCHTPGYSPIVMKQLMREFFGDGYIESGEMVLSTPGLTNYVPSGTFARWVPNDT